MIRIVAPVVVSFSMAISVGLATENVHWGMASLMFGLLLGQIAVKS